MTEMRFWVMWFCHHAHGDVGLEGSSTELIVVVHWLWGMCMRRMQHAIYCQGFPQQRQCFPPIQEPPVPPYFSIPASEVNCCCCHAVYVFVLAAWIALLSTQHIIIAGCILSRKLSCCHEALPVSDMANSHHNITLTITIAITICITNTVTAIIAIVHVIIGGGGKNGFLQCVGARNEVELAMQHTSHLPIPTHTSGTNQAQHQHHSQGQPGQQQQAPELPQQQQPQHNGLQEPSQQHNAHSTAPHQQPNASPFMSPHNGQPHNGQPEWDNGQQRQWQQQQAIMDSDSAPLPGSGSQPVSLDQHPSELPCPSPGSALGQEQGQMPKRGRETGLGVGSGGGSGMSDDDEAMMRAAGLGAHAEEELRGLSRLEEDALEAKVAGPIGQLPLPFSLVTETNLPSPPFPFPPLPSPPPLLLMSLLSEAIILCLHTSV